ncbi:MAG: site-2 protease family protein [Candidatus Accumulibacter sp.]|jgi:Zn-dependent protease|nr:site-2 protease family protein [Accumulibacter sp.]
MDFQGLLFKICTMAPPIVLAITVHEAAHAYAAYRLGDTTAQRAGRLSLNPLRHVDLFGTVLVPAALLSMNLPGFGWAKPVPIDPGRLRDPKRDVFWVAAAGPASNALMAILWTALFKLVFNPADDVPMTALESMFWIGIGINLALMTFNLLPLPPLDGGRIAMSLLPVPWARKLGRVEPFGFLVLLGLLYFGFLDRVLSPLLEIQVGFLFRIFRMLPSV